MLFLVATNVVASRPPECRPTGMPQARAKILRFVKFYTLPGSEISFGSRTKSFEAMGSFFGIRPSFYVLMRWFNETPQKVLEILFSK